MLWEDSTAEHTVLECTRWNEKRLAMVNEIGQQLTTENITCYMLESERKWKTIEKTVRDILKAKEEDDRERQNAHELLILDARGGEM